MSIGDLYAAGQDVTVGDLWVSPAELEARLQAVRAYVDGIALDVNRNAANPRMTEGWRAAWTEFLTRWGAFYADTHDSILRGLFPGLSGADSMIARYSEEAKRWAQALRDIGGSRTQVPTNLPEPPRPFDPSTLNPFRVSAGPFVWTLLGVGVLGLAVAWKRS